MSKEQEVIDLVRKLTQAAGVPGYEGDVAAILFDELEPLCDRAELDRMGNAWFTFNAAAEPSAAGGSDAGAAAGNASKLSSDRVPHLVLVAHQDEVGFMVASVLPGGFLRIQNLGLWNPLTMPSSSVEVITRTGRRLPGVIGSIPPHFQKDRKPEIPLIGELFVDVGAADRQDAESRLGIRPGDLVIPAAPFVWHPETRAVFSKAFDDRIGLAALVLLGRELAGRDDLPCRVTLAATVQEEVENRGADLFSRSVDADAVIIVEGAPADDMPGGAETPQTQFGKGAHVRIYDPTLISDPGLLSFVRSVAEARSLRIQEAVRSRGGTDGRVLQYAAGGTPVMVTGVPVRYAHSHNSLVNLDDLYELTSLLEAVCLEFDSDSLQRSYSIRRNGLSGSRLTGETERADEKRQ